MACDLETTQAAACASGIGKLDSPITLLQIIAQLSCEIADVGGGGGGGTPAPPINSVQFNDTGAFGGDAAFIFSGGLLTVTNILSPGRLATSNRSLIDSGAVVAFDWEAKTITDSAGNLAAIFNPGGNRVLIDDGGAVSSVDWNQRLLNDTAQAVSADWQNRLLADSAGQTAVSWDGRFLMTTGGTTVLDFSAQQPSSGAQVAGGVYTATEQVMIQEMYDAMRAYGLLS